MQNKFEYTWNNWQRRITADKRLRCYAPSPKLPSPTSFIRKTLYEMAAGKYDE